MDLTFQFDSLQAFMWMDGHGPYVWACYGITFAAIGFLVVQPKLARRRFIREQRALARRQNSAATEAL